MKKAKDSLFITSILFSIFSFAMLAYLGFSYFEGSARQEKLNQCHDVHLEGNYHIHTHLQIMQDGVEVRVPENVGVSGDCVHPVHTHDATGWIHVDYPTRVDFTLGDFFDVQGLVFSDSQIGEIKTIDGYKIDVFVNEERVDGGFRDVKLFDQDEIEIRITSPDSE